MHSPLENVRSHQCEGQHAHHQRYNSKIVSVALRPRMMVLPVMNPMIWTAGIVRLMLDGAVPSERLMERRS